MTYTRKCFDPWFFRNIHAGGMICPCCAMHDTDYGDYLIDSDSYLSNDLQEVFYNSAVKRLKEGLLTGNLNPMCQKCVLVPKDLIDINEYRILLEKQFEEKGIDYKGKAYEEIKCIERVGIGITNRCNLRCIYCNQSVLADTNPYFKMDFPNEKMQECLQLLVRMGVKIIETGAFGEATIHKDWCRIFAEFHRNNPQIELRLFTNLNKRYTDEEICLLAEHKNLVVSIDTLDPILFAKLRVNGDIGLILNNLDKVEKEMDKRGYSHNRIRINAIACNLTWKSIEELGSYAVAHGYGIAVNNLELRYNSEGVKNKEIYPVERLNEKDRKEFQKLLMDLKAKADQKGVAFASNAWLQDRVADNYNEFIPDSDNPILQAFYNKWPSGRPDIYLGTAYDMFLNQYSGIVICRGTKAVCLKLSRSYDYFTVRKVYIYGEGKCTPKYEQRVFPDYRKKINSGDLFDITFDAPDEGVDRILFQIIEWKE